MENSNSEKEPKNDNEVDPASPNRDSSNLSANESKSPLTEPDAVSLSPQALEMIMQREEKVTRAIMVNPSVVETLAQSDPTKLIEFANASDERQYNYALRVAEFKHIENKAKENTNRIVLAGIFAVVAMTFVYAALTGDNTLSERIIDVVIGGTGGAGLIALLLSGKSRNNSDE